MDGINATHPLTLTFPLTTTTESDIIDISLSFSGNAFRQYAGMTISMINGTRSQIIWKIFFVFIFCIFSFSLLMIEHASFPRHVLPRLLRPRSSVHQKNHDFESVSEQEFCIIGWFSGFASSDSVSYVVDGDVGYEL